MRIAALCATALLITACSGAQPVERKGTAAGAGAGAVIGGTLGAIFSKDDVKGVGLGATAGAAAGAIVGSLFDRQQKAFEGELENERAQNAVEIERVRDDLLRINLTNEVSFDYDSAEIKPAFLDTIGKLADVLNKFDRSDAIVIGHTDSTGSDTYNLDLSERRALAVTEALEVYGVAPFRLEALGRGEEEPRATNATEAGRQLNRRVEILVSDNGA